MQRHDNLIPFLPKERKLINYFEFLIDKYAMGRQTQIEEELKTLEKMYISTKNRANYQWVNKKQHIVRCENCGKIYKFKYSNIELYPFCQQCGSEMSFIEIGTERCRNCKYWRGYASYDNEKGLCKLTDTSLIDAYSVCENYKRKNFKEIESAEFENEQK